ncbi:MAG: molybdopterin molybdotransferase MoeA [Planktotalea sp.]|uniref:molybdopterin molybdotransferase MoeA n=1 Tax=Planktotalea sp. TaxID=2029877 RepID=UPI00261FEC79|nr:gephyrin-like molybdotransferase Glp [Planktotalea sp.]MDG1076256.1 molybdopterin molybdotransferase MoeA [Planktotalea sp.]
MIALETRYTDHCKCCTDEPNSMLLSMDDALSIISNRASPIRDTKTVALHAAQGRVLAQDVTARTDAPPFDNAAVDGYALHTDALPGDGPWNLRVIERVAAGQTAKPKVSSLFATRIFTGAAVPAQANAIVMQEDVTRSGSTATIVRNVKPGAHIRYAGEDMARGDTVLQRGAILSPAEIAACAVAGFGQVDVVRKVRVALVVTGDEVQTPGTTLSPGCIWDVNTPMLSSLLSRPLIDLVQVVHIKDQNRRTQTLLRELSGQVDLIITSGGLSVGEEDHVRPAISELGGHTDFSGVAIKPGKPVSFGRLGRCHWLGLPGNPLAAFMTWKIFGEAILRALTNQETHKSLRRNVLLSKSIRRKSGRCELRLAQVVGFTANGQEMVSFQDATHSGRVASLPTADGVIYLPKDVDFLPTGAMVEFLPFCRSKG